ncbi:retropepsin-like aspartic protease [Flavobacterium terrae]|uniref:Aspartyl protease n=1 Tax=Flavobacterium terrae TaxID=415425 RepID=A0A1M6HFV5_9FLAO|nr:aspartyl protease family protein [Flavobacterium terrae]SHJ20994.1 Aspartyl protease [Flavobacterium terrae]
MKKKYSILILLLFNQIIFSQGGFKFSSSKKTITIPFQLANNLIIIPVELNGVDLNFLVDTGVESTILFSLNEADSISFNNIEKIKIKGLGSGESIDALHSKNNRLVINEFEDFNHEFFIILDEEVNFSSQLGVPVHGIIGYHFFKNHFIEINYKTKKISIFNDILDYSKSKLKKFDKVPISIELEKPYIFSSVLLNNEEINTKLLVDTGGSDAIWLFEDENKIQCSDVFFIDYLGKGFSGEIHGKRSRIQKIKIGNNELISPTISFPDKESLQNVSLVVGRNGSLGSEVLRRFTILFDYKNGNMFLKKNSYFDDPFNYNMSGMEIEHGGLQWIKEEIQLKASFVSNEKNEISVYESDPKSSLKYQFSLKPRYEITNVRKSSPADLAGIKKGDVIQRLNGNNAFKYKLQDIISIMQSEEGKWIRLDVERNGVIFKTKFQLKKIL